MTPHNSQLSALHSQLIIILLFAASCNIEHSNDDIKVPAIVAADTIFSSPLDSLKWVINTGTDEQKMGALSEMDENYRSSNPETVFKHAKNLYTLFAKKEDNISKGRTASIIGAVYFESGKNDSALYYFNESVSFFEKGDDEKYLASSRIRLAQAQSSALEYDKAIDNYLKALSYFEKNYQPNRIQTIYNNIALMYETMGNFDKQEEYLSKAVDMFKKEEITKDYQAAFDDAKRAEALMDTTDLANMDFLYYQLTRAAIGTKNREAGFEYLSYYWEASHKQQNNILAEKTSEIETIHETAKKEIEIERQKQIIKSQNLQRGLLAGGIAISATEVVLLEQMR